MGHRQGRGVRRTGCAAAALLLTAGVGACGRLGYEPVATAGGPPAPHEDAGIGDGRSPVRDAGPPGSDRDAGVERVDADARDTSAPDAASPDARVADAAPSLDLAADRPAPPDATPRPAPPDATPPADTGAPAPDGAASDGGASSEIVLTGRTGDCQLFTWRQRAHALCTSPLPWQAARQRCQGLGLDLAILDSQEIEVAIREVVTIGDVWIGLSDLATEGTFVWVDGRPLVYRNWMPNEPNDALGQEDCVYARSGQGWNDADCDVPRSYLCGRR